MVAVVTRSSICFLEKSPTILCAGKPQWNKGPNKNFHEHAIYVHRVSAVNFRIFGARDTGKSLDITLNSGLNVLVGENDAGKTSIVDVLRGIHRDAQGQVSHLASAGS